MRGQVRVFTLASVALLSCRAVLGIEEIDEGGDAGTTADSGTTDAAADSIGTDSATDAGTDSASDGANEACKALGQGCGKCCRDSNQPGNKELEETFAACLCDGGCAPANECSATTICGGSADPKTSGCIPCIDQVIWNAKCGKERDACSKSPTCKPVLDCIDTCN